MQRSGRPGLADFMQLSQGFLNVAQGHRAQEAHNQAQEFNEKKMAHFDQQAQWEKEDRDVDLQVDRLTPRYMEAMEKGVPISHLDRIGVEDGQEVNPRAARRAQVAAAKQIRLQQEMDVANMQMMGQQWEMERQNGLRMAQQAQIALDRGDMETFNQITDTIYNTVIHDGQWINGRRPTGDPSGAQAMELETVDGIQGEVIDDLTPEQKMDIIQKSLMDPKEYFTSRWGAKAARMEFNAENWAEDPVALVGDDGTPFYAVKQVDPDTGRAVTLVFDTYPHPGAEPVRTERGTKLLDRAGVDLQGKQKGGGATPMTIQQGAKQLENRYGRTDNFGKMQWHHQDGQKQYRVAREKFNELVDAGMAAHNAETQAYNHVEQLERDYFEALSTYPDRREEVRKKFEVEFGYVPDEKRAPPDIDLGKKKGGVLRGFFGGK